MCHATKRTSTRGEANVTGRGGSVPKSRSKEVYKLCYPGDIVFMLFDLESGEEDIGVVYISAAGPG